MSEKIPTQQQMDEWIEHEDREIAKAVKDDVITDSQLAEWAQAIEDGWCPDSISGQLLIAEVLRLREEAEIFEENEMLRLRQTKAELSQVSQRLAAALEALRVIHDSLKDRLDNGMVPRSVDKELLAKAAAILENANA